MDKNTQLKGWTHNTNKLTWNMFLFQPQKLSKYIETTKALTRFLSLWWRSTKQKWRGDKYKWNWDKIDNYKNKIRFVEKIK